MKAFTKVLTALLIQITFILLTFNLSFAQTPPPPNGGNNPTDPDSGNTPVGGGAPIAGGLGILLALGGAYGIMKVYPFEKYKNE